MCYLCDQDRIFATYGINAETVAAKLHYQQTGFAFIPDGVGGDLKVPNFVPLLNTTLIDTVPGDTSSTVTITVDAPSIKSTIDVVGDEDFYAVTLEAGKSYEIGMYGFVGGMGGVPLSDSYVELYDAAGNLLTQADGGANTPLNTTNSGFDVLLNFTPDTTGTYYVNARAFDNVPEDGTNGDLVGDYEVFVNDVTGQAVYTPYYDLDSPLHSIDWGTQVNKVHQSSRNPDGDEGTRATGNAPAAVDPGAAFGHPGKNVISIYFAKAGDVFASNDPTQPGLPPVTITATGAQQFERDAVFTALREFEKVADIVYVEVQDRTQADFVYTSYQGTPGPGVSLLGSMSPPDESDEGLAQFNSGDYRWNATDLQQGGFSFVTLIHEFGHGHGLAHPHDNGGRSSIMRGVTSDGPVADYTLGDFSLNQAVFTMMSYQDGWPESPHGNAPTDVGYGYLGGLMAFDIAAIQDKYGVNEEWATGNDVYVLKDVNAAGTYYTSIWDGGGRDAIAYEGTRDTVIDLRAATLQYETGGGGRVSYASGIFGGFTVANGVTIENAVGGDGNDRLIGNAADNVLTGNGGNDILDGGAGQNGLNGGAGDDTVTYASAAQGVTVALGARGYTATGVSSDRWVSVENVIGSDFDDTLTGGTRGGRLDGGLGDDAMMGGRAADVLDGGAGRDKLRGGAGADIFVFDDGDSGGTVAAADRIFDLQKGDTIDLRGIDAIAGGEDDAFTLVSGGAFTGTAGELIVTTSKGGRFDMLMDTDGDMVADIVISAFGTSPVDATLQL